MAADVSRVAVAIVAVVFFLARERAARAGGGRIDRGFRLGQVALADGDAVVSALRQFRRRRDTASASRRSCI